MNEERVSALDLRVIEIGGVIPSLRLLSAVVKQIGVPYRNVEFLLAGSQALVLVTL